MRVDGMRWGGHPWKRKSRSRAAQKPLHHLAPVQALSPSLQHSQVRTLFHTSTRPSWYGVMVSLAGTSIQDFLSVIIAPVWLALGGKP